MWAQSNLRASEATSMLRRAATRDVKMLAFALARGATRVLHGVPCRPNFSQQKSFDPERWYAGGRLSSATLQQVVQAPQRGAFAGLGQIRTMASALHGGFFAPPSSSGGREKSSGGGGSSRSSFSFWSHASVAASSGLTLVASADELKKEQEAGDQLIDMMMPLLSQLSMGSALVRVRSVCVCARSRDGCPCIVPGRVWRFIPRTVCPRCGKLPFF
jgi:hypothetical protein